MQLDATLRGQVVEEDTRLNVRIDSLTASASVAGTTVAIDVRFQQMTADLKRLEEHINVRTAELGSVIQAEKGDARQAFTNVKTEVTRIASRIEALETRPPTASPASPTGFGAEFGANFSAKDSGGFPVGGGTSGAQKQ